MLSNFRYSNVWLDVDGALAGDALELAAHHQLLQGRHADQRQDGDHRDHHQQFQQGKMILNVSRYNLYIISHLRFDFGYLCNNGIREIILSNVRILGHKKCES